MIFDTSVLIALERGVHGGKTRCGKGKRALRHQRCHCVRVFAWRSSCGFREKATHQGAFVEKIIQTFPLYPFDLSAARIYAKLWANLAKKGVTIGAHDLMIASTAIALGFSVVIADGDYSKIKEVSVEKVVM